MSITRQIDLQRHNDAQPILSPGHAWWESGATLNAAVTHLPRSPGNDRILAGMVEDLSDPRLADGAVAVHYRARPLRDPDCPWNRSFIGLAVFTPDFRLLKRFANPVLTPNEAEDAHDHLGVEDPRITRIGDAFVMAYCGVSKTPAGRGIDAGSGINFGLCGNLCLARSCDLLRWERLRVNWGNVQAHDNKDVVLFPEQFAGHYYLLHRPYFPTAGTQVDYAIHLARSRDLAGPWEDCGMVLHSWPDPSYLESWVGAGTVPIALGDGRFLVLYHTGHRISRSQVEYDVGAAVFNLNDWSPRDPQAVVERRMERIMWPQAPCELTSRMPDSVSNVIFPCGSFERDGRIEMVYGAADSCLMAAGFNRHRLLELLEQSREPAYVPPRAKVQVTIAVGRQNPVLRGSS